MARQATGAIVEHQGKDRRTYRGLRFTAYGKRRFVSLGPVTAGEAEAELRHVLADVERGTWQPSRSVEPPPESEPIPTFHEYAEQWWLRNEGRLTARTQKDYRWRLELHLIPAFGETRLDRITFDAVERYIASKLAASPPLSPRSINMTVTLLGAILEGAVERELISRNPAKGKGRRLREHKGRRSYLETAGQIAALLDAAGELDAEATRERQHLSKRATLATMIYTGVRVGEVCSLRWRDVDLQAERLHVPGTKTGEADRFVKIRGALRLELQALKDRGPVDQHAYLFPTRTGRRQYETKIRVSNLVAAVKRANANLAKKDLPPLPDNLTPHSLRRTFATVLYALGESPPVVMAEMGHTSPALALRIYAQAARLSDDEREQLAALVAGEPAPNRAGADVVPIERARGQRRAGGEGSQLADNGIRAGEAPSEAAVSQTA
jgi:integrase